MTEIRNLINGLKKISIKEAGLSRIQQAIADPNKRFAIISANRSENSDEENNIATRNLADDIIAMGLGFTKMQGGYLETTEDGNVVPVVERSYFVMNMTKEQAIELCKKYNQESVLFKDGEGMRYLKQDGSVDAEFMANTDDNMVTDNDYELKRVGQYFSRRVQGGNQRNAFAFKLKEDYLGIQGWEWGRTTVKQYNNLEKFEDYERIL